MFRREMKCEFFENPASFLWRKCFVQRSWFMRAEVVQNNADQDGIRIEHIHQPFHALSKINHGMSFCDSHITFPGQGFIKHVQVADTIAFVLIIVALLAPCLAGVSQTSFFNQLFLPFIKTNLGAAGIVGPFIFIQNIFHASYIFRTGFLNAPHFLLPGLYLVFLSVRRIVSYEIEATTSNSTIFPASKRRVQCSCPSGTSLQAVAIRVASARPSNLRRWPGRGSSFSALCKPPNTNRLRIRSTQGRLMFKADMICGSDKPSLAFSNIIARFIWRALIFPLRVISNNVCCSSAFRLIWYSFFGILDVSLPPLVARNVPSYSR